MDGVHVMDKRLHCLVDAADSHIDSVLFQSFVSFETIQVFLQVILDFSVLQIVEIPVLQHCQLGNLLDICLSYIRRKIEVECRNGLTSMHFILDRLHGNTCENRSGLYPLRRS